MQGHSGCDGVLRYGHCMSRPAPTPGSISVVIPAFGVAQFLAAAIESVAMCEAVAELVVVTDGSPDDAEVAARALSGVAKGRLLALPENHGLTAARNIGLREVTGDLVIFLDGDDLLEPSGPEVLASALRGSPGALVAVGATQRVDVSGEPSGFDHMGRDWGHHAVRRSGRLVPWTIDQEALLTRNLLGHPGSALFDAESLCCIGGWDEDLRTAEFSELVLRVLRVGGVVQVDAPAFRYRSLEGQVTRSGRSFERSQLAMLHRVMCRAPANELPAIRRAVRARYADRRRRTLSRGWSLATARSAVVFELTSWVLWLRVAAEPLRRWWAGRLPDPPPIRRSGLSESDREHDGSPKPSDSESPSGWLEQARHPQGNTEERPEASRSD